MSELANAEIEIKRAGKRVSWPIPGRKVVKPLVFALLYSLIHSFTHSLLAQPRTNGTGPGERYYPVHNFRDEFLVYDDATKAYIPYIDEFHADETALSLFIDLESNRNYTLLLRTEQDSYLFVNAALKRKLQAGQWQLLRIDSLYRAYHRPARPDAPAPHTELFLTLYGPPGVQGKQVIIGQPISTTQKAVVLRDDNLSVRPRIRSAYSNFLGAGLLFLLATHALLYALYPRAFRRIFNIRDLLSLRSDEDSFLINRPLSSANVLFVGNLGLVTAYLIVFLQSRNIDVMTPGRLFAGEQQSAWLVGEFVGLGIAAFVTLLGKYFLLEVIGGLYKLQDIVNIHFFKALQSSALFFTGLTLLLSVIAYNTSATGWVPELLLPLLLLFYLVRLGWFYVVIRSQESIKNLYLFSYLCIVELIPLIIGLRFAL